MTRLERLELSKRRPYARKNPAVQLSHRSRDAPLPIAHWVRFQFKGKYMTIRAAACTAVVLLPLIAPCQTLACNTGSSWSTATGAAVA